MEKRRTDAREEGELRCPVCGSTNIEYVKDYLVCLDCGHVIEEDIIDTGPERRFFTQEDYTKKRTVSGDTILGLPTHQIYIQGDKFISRLIPKDARNRNTLYAMSILNELAVRLNLPKNVKDLVLNYYKLLSEKKTIRKEKVKPIVAALIYIASRKAGVPRPLDKISKVSEVRKKDISKAYRIVKETLKLSVPVLDPERFIIMFGRELGLSGETIQKGLRIIREVKEKGTIIGRDPTGIAAAAIYIATKITGEKITQKQVAEQAGVTEVTVRNRYREIVKLLNLEIDED